MQSSTFIQDITAYVHDTRHRFLSPRAVVEEMSLVPGDHVVHIHARSGHFAEHVARKVGEKGCIYLHGDCGPAHFAAYRDTFGNISGHVCSVPDSEDGVLDIDTGIVDAAVLLVSDVREDTLDTLLAEVARVLRRGGTLCVLDWREAQTDAVTQVAEQRRAAVPPFLGGASQEACIHTEGVRLRVHTPLSYDTCKEHVARAGFLATKQLPEHAVGLYHYGILYTRV